MALQPVTQGLSRPLCPGAVGQVWAQSWLSQLGLAAVPAGPLAGKESGLLLSTPQLPGPPPPPWVMQPRSRGAEETTSNLGDQRTHQPPFLGQEARGRGTLRRWACVLQTQHGSRSPKGVGRSEPLPPGPRGRSPVPCRVGTPGAWPLTCPVAPRPPQVQGWSRQPHWGRAREARVLYSLEFTFAPTPGVHHVYCQAVGVPETGLLRESPAAPGPERSALSVSCA